MQGQDHPDDAHINMSNVVAELKTRFRSANTYRRAALGIRPPPGESTVAQCKAYYKMYLVQLRRNTQILTALYKPHHYAALQEQSCQIIELRQKRISSEGTAKCSRVKQAS